MPDSKQLLVAELAIVRAKKDLLSRQALLWTLAATSLVVPTPDADYNGDLSAFTPLLVRDDTQNFLVVFTDARRMGRFAEKAPQFIMMSGRDVIVGLPPQTGIVVNPESDLGFELPWQGVAAMRDELRLPDE